MIDDPIRRHAEKRRARRLVRVKLPARRDISDIARGALLDERGPFEIGRGRRVRDRVKVPFLVHPGKPVALASERVFRMIQRHANEPVSRGLRRVPFVNQEVVDRKTAFFHNRPHLGKPGILIPPAALMKIREGKKTGDEQHQLETLGTRHRERELRRLRIIKGKVDAIENRRIAQEELRTRIGPPLSLPPPAPTAPASPAKGSGHSRLQSPPRSKSPNRLAGKLFVSHCD